MLHTRQRFLVNLPRGSHSKHDTSGCTSGSPGRGKYGHAWQLLLRILHPTRTRLAVPAPSLLSSHTCPHEGQSEEIAVLRPRRYLPLQRDCGRHGPDRLTSPSFCRLTCKRDVQSTIMIAAIELLKGRLRVSRPYPCISCRQKPRKCDGQWNVRPPYCTF